ncbi:outer membrane protein assembly factor BamA [Candidatus Neomarinimicrobiota bacterium]
MGCRLHTLLLLFSLGTVLTAAPGRDRFTITSVEFVGNQVFSDKRLSRIMISKPSSPFKKNAYRQEFLDDDIGTLELFYRQNGYLEAAVTNAQVIVDSLKRRISIRITIEEGSLTRIEDVVILGNITYSDEVLRPRIPLKSGDPFRIKQVEAGTLALLRYYAEHGYLEAVIQPDITRQMDEHLTVVHYDIRENQQFRIHEIHMEGLQTSRQRIVNRELQFKTGDIISYLQLLQSQKRLYLTGLFKSVFITPKSSASGDLTTKDILIEVEENMPKEFNASIGYRTVERLLGKVELSNANIGGWGLKSSVRAHISIVDRNLEWSFTNPRVFYSYWGLDFNTYTRYFKHPGYTLTSSGFRFSQGRKLDTTLLMNLIYHLDNGHVSSAQDSEPTAPEDTRIRSLSLAVSHDTRDNPFDPRSGHQMEWSNEFSGAVLSSSSSFIRSNFKCGFYRSLASDRVLASGLDLGWMSTPKGLAGVPLNERYFAGGPNSMRGFEYRLLGPLTQSRIPTGGLIRLIWHAAEIRYPIYKNLVGAAFIEFGNVWEEAKDITFSSIRFSIGGGCRFNSPIGLIRIDCGFNPNPLSDEPGIKIYLSTGQAF